MPHEVKCKLQTLEVNPIKGSTFQTTCGHMMSLLFSEHPKGCPACKKPFDIPHDGLPHGFLEMMYGTASPT